MNEHPNLYGVCTETRWKKVYLSELDSQILEKPRAITDIDRTETAIAAPWYEAVTGLKFYPYSKPLQIYE
jgi:hypothetical protein